MHRHGIAVLGFALALSHVHAQSMGLLGVDVPTTLRRTVSGDNLQVTASQLRAIAPGLSWERAGQLVTPLSLAMLEFDVTSPARRAAFLAQVAHESAGFAYLVEQNDGWQYEGRKNLGNTQAGDGPRYRGRGFIQLTGRANYRAAGAALQLDLEANPALAEDVDVAARTAAWFWAAHGCNQLADRGDFHAITLAINGGTNGLADRWTYYGRAKKAVGIA